jgi:putative ATPase
VSVAELRDVLFFARKHLEHSILLFIDEIHRFNKTQQEFLLPDVEDANLRLIGATKHNPGFYVIPPLFSRIHLLKLNPVSIDAISRILKRALSDDERGLGPMKCQAKKDVIVSIAMLANGEMRWVLNALETIVTSLSIGSEIEDKDVRHFSMERALRYDADEDEHDYIISAYIKSMRAATKMRQFFALRKCCLVGKILDLLLVEW